MSIQDLIKFGQRLVTASRTGGSGCNVYRSLLRACLNDLTSFVKARISSWALVPHLTAPKMKAFQ
jgi:hypothetical protein